MKGKLNIYIVEDERIVALDIRNNVISIGHSLAGISSSGEDCLEKLKTVKPDLILMDINLAGELTGIETVEIINETLNVPIVFLTAYSDDETLNEIKKAGYYGYITKPFKELKLKTEIEFTYDRFKKLLKLRKERETSQIILREREEFFKQVVDSVNDIIYRIDLKGYFTYLNPSAINQTGYSYDEMLKLRYTTLIRDDFRQKAFLFFKNVFQKKIDNSYFEFPLITKDGSELWLGQKIHLLKSQTSIVGFQVIARDITKEREFKEQLIIAKRNAENTAQIKSQFLANMSHEIRTPLNGIMGVVNLLDKTELSEKQQIYINAINSSSNQLMGIINDVLDLSKIEAGKVEILASEFDLYELISAVISIFEIKSNDKGIGITFTIDSDVPQFVIGDSTRLNQIMYNLLGNAVKFTNDGGVNLTISLLNEDDFETEILFQVLDSGIGMADGVTEKIFEPFTQAESDTTRKFGGTGLGLAIVKKLVELQNGSIEVKSKINEGSSFEIRLKFKKLKVPKQINSAEDEQLNIDLKGLKILLVEDNPINQLVTKDLLEQQMSKVTIAGNGEIALALLKIYQFDIILMDMQMPILDGYQAMSMIRESEDDKLNSMPIIALTANAIETEIKKCFSHGADDYLSKPFKPNHLYQKVNGLVKNKPSNENQETNLDEHLDVNTLTVFTNGNVELVNSTLNELKKSFNLDQEALKKAFVSENVQLLRSIAHKIKPNFMLVGMNKLGQLCKDIEHIESTEQVFIKSQELLKAMPIIINEIDDYTQRRIVHTRVT
jgi:PAS domain S-box-containing protein